jgi:hypothetical protein
MPDPLTREFVSLDDPMTVARARIIVIGGETAESVAMRAIIFASARRI